MKSDIYFSLTEQERKTLKLCGITTTAQLARVTAADLAADIAKAQQFFPDEVSDFDPQRLEWICSASAACKPDTGRDVQEKQLSQQAEDRGVFLKRLKPILRARYGNREQKGTGEKKVNRRGAGDSKKHSHFIPIDAPIFCKYPVRVYIGAFSTLLLQADLLVLVVVLLCLLTGMELPGEPHIIFSIIIISLVPYIIFGHFVSCPVCSLRFFPILHSYPHNKRAHYLPLLGYTGATALHIILFLWFYCPACGTSEKLTGKRHHQHYH